MSRRPRLVSKSYWPATGRGGNFGPPNPRYVFVGKLLNLVVQAASQPASQAASTATKILVCCSHLLLCLLVCRMVNCRMVNCRNISSMPPMASTRKPVNEIQYCNMTHVRCAACLSTAVVVTSQYCQCVVIMFPNTSLKDCAGGHPELPSLVVAWR